MMDFKKYFIEDNKNGIKATEKWLKKNNPELYEKIISYIIEDDLPFNQKVTLFINNLKEVPKCTNCEKKVKYKGTVKRGYGEFCSLKCFNNSDENAKRVKSTITKEKLEIAKKKRKKTFIERHGVENPMHKDEFKENLKKTLLEKYGVESVASIDHVKKHVRKKAIADRNIEYNKIGYTAIGFDYEIRNNSKLFTHEIKCNNEHIFKIHDGTLKYRLNNNIIICTECNPIKSFSGLENKVIEYIKSIYSGEIILKDRKILDGKEIDIYIPKFNLGIEINGNYWYSELYKNSVYHSNKTNKAIKKGIKLLQFFEDEINNKFDIIKSIIKTNLNKNTVIYARKCKIKKIDYKTATEFIKDNHMQGEKIKSTVYLGLYHNEKLLSVMSFGKLRPFMKKAKEFSDLEIHRFCSKKGYTIVGGASKLFKHYIKSYNVKNIVTFCDLRFGYGNLYEKLGFTLKYTTEPNYTYINPNTNEREHKLNFSKNRLIKEGYNIKDTTVKEIMNERGYYKIYDCGNRMFYYENTTD